MPKSFLVKKWVAPPDSTESQNPLPDAELMHENGKISRSCSFKARYFFLHLQFIYSLYIKSVMNVRCIWLRQCLLNLATKLILRHHEILLNLLKNSCLGSTSFLVNHDHAWFLRFFCVLLNSPRTIVSAPSKLGKAWFWWLQILNGSLYMHTEINLYYHFFVSAGQTVDYEMAREEEKDVKEPKRSTSNRPFDIENLFAPDKPSKKQKTSPELSKIDEYRPNFPTVESAALSVNGNYTLWHFSLLHNKRNIECSRFCFTLAKVLVAICVYNQSKNICGALTVTLTLFLRFRMRENNKNFRVTETQSETHKQTTEMCTGGNVNMRTPRFKSFSFNFGNQNLRIGVIRHTGNYLANL